MCGIFGYYDRAREVMPEDKFLAMGNILEHRGPDDHGAYHQSGRGLGNRRLSIMDVEHGHQPFRSEDGEVVVVQNGEIYNHVELAAELANSGFPCRTTCDTEVILRLYEKEGIDFVHRLNGMFAIAIYDRRSDELFLIRDRIGVKPLFIHDDGNRLSFASEIKSIIASGVPNQVDFEAVHHFLTYNYVPPPFTISKGVRHLMPGHWMRISRNGDIREHKWWDLHAQEVVSNSEAEWIEEFNCLFDDAVRIRLRSDVPVGAFLSGGVDSGSVVGVMARHLEKPFKTFCIGFNEKRYDESPFAEMIASKFGTEHIMEKVDPNMLDLWPKATWFCDQPHGDVSFLPTYKVASLAAQHLKVVLTGDGGDELFAGYDKYRDFFSSQDPAGSKDDFQRSYYRNISLFSDDEKSNLYTESMRQHTRGINSFDLVRPIFKNADHHDYINQALSIDMLLLLPGNNLVKPDRMGMAVSVEARTPFLDYRMMEFAFRTQGQYKLHRNETKYLLKKAVTPLIGEELAYRKKQMFTVPVGEWFKRDLAKYTEDVLLSEKAVSRGLFQFDVVRKMLKAHQASEINYTREIRALIAVELWAQVYIDQDLPEAPAILGHGSAAKG